MDFLDRLTMPSCWAVSGTKPVHRDEFQGSKQMVSHPVVEGGNFLSPQGRTQGIPTKEQRHGRDACSSPKNGTKEWATQAMHSYKQSGCQVVKEKLVIYYMEGFVQRVAMKLASRLPRSVDPADLAQAGYFGLCSCIDKYDPHLNSRFEGYARRRIEGSMRDLLRKEDPASRLARSRSTMILNGIEEFKAQFGRPPTDIELQELLHVDKQEFAAIMRDRHVPCTVSFQPTEGNEDGMATIYIQQNNIGVERIERADLHKWLCRHLNHYDRLIVTLYYAENLSLWDIGVVLGFCEARISQRLKQILLILKARIKNNPEVMLLMAS